MANKFSTLTVSIFMLAGATPGLASHANPWASDEDTVNAQYHDINQARSIDTPGEDEMNGRMTRSAFGKLGRGGSGTGGRGGNGGNAGHGGGGTGGHGGGGGQGRH